MARFVGICIFTSVCMVAFLGSNHARDPGRRPPSAIPGPVNERYVFSSVGLHGSCIKLYPLSPPYWAHGGGGGGVVVVVQLSSVLGFLGLRVPNSRIGNLPGCSEYSSKVWEKLSRIKVTPDLNCETLVSDLVGLPWRVKFCRAGSAESEFILLLQAGHDAHSGGGERYHISI